MFGFSKISIYVFIAIASIGAITTTYYVWKRSIEHAALLEFNRQQMEQTAKDQAEFIRKQQEISDQQAAATRALIEQNNTLNRKMSGIDNFLTSSQSQDKPSSEILKQTIERLSVGEDSSNGEPPKKIIVRPRK